VTLSLQTAADAVAAFDQRSPHGNPNEPNVLDSIIIIEAAVGWGGNVLTFKRSNVLTKLFAFSPFRER
jgi:hypothetical protein